MKRFLCAVLSLLILLAFTGCEKNNSQSRTTTTAQTKSQASRDEKIDIDLTRLSSTLVYSEVYNMMKSPSKYIEKRVKMKGKFALYNATDSDGNQIPEQIYFACVIDDATSCCQQGLEFVLASDHKYPEDYPKIGSEITVVGKFQTYMEGTQQFCHLVNSEIIDK